MRQGRILWLCLVAAFALSGLVASSALAAEAPTVNRLEPSQGPTEYQGTFTVYIKGSGFQEGAKVKFGTTEPESVSVISNSEIAVPLPNHHEAGEVEVTVEDENGTSTGGPNFIFRAPEKPKPHWAKLKNCPVHSEINGKTPVHCNWASTTPNVGGFFSVGGITVPIVKPIVLQGGSSEEEYEVDGFPGESGTGGQFEIVFPPTDGVPAVSRSPEKVPVEVLNNVSEEEMNEFGWPQNLRDSYKLAKKKGYFKANKTTENIEVAGNDSQYLSPFNIIVEEGPAIIARVQIKGENPWLTILGGSCQIGSEAEPVIQHLFAGTSVSPLSTEEHPLIMHGKPGFVSLTHSFEMANLTEQTLVDNTYAVPGAKGCGGSQWESYLDPVVNKAFGIPAPAGASETQLNGQQATATRGSAENHLGL